MKLLPNAELKGVRVEQDPSRSGEVFIHGDKLRPGKYARVIPEKWRDVFWLQTLSNHSDKYAAYNGDGLFVNRALLLNSGLLTRGQEKKIRFMSTKD